VLRLRRSTCGAVERRMVDEAGEMVKWRGLCVKRRCTIVDVASSVVGAWCYDVGNGEAVRSPVVSVALKAAPSLRCSLLNTGSNAKSQAQN
jgi:hypothetical protein